MRGIASERRADSASTLAVANSAATRRWFARPSGVPALGNSGMRVAARYLRPPRARVATILEPSALIPVEPLPALSSQPARENHPLQERRRRVRRLAEFLEHDVRDVVGRVGGRGNPEGRRYPRV